MYAIALINKGTDDVAGLFIRRVEDRGGYDLQFTDGDVLESETYIRSRKGGAAKIYDSIGTATRIMKQLTSGVYGLMLGTDWVGVVLSASTDNIEVGFNFDSEPDQFYSLEVVEVSEEALLAR